MKEHLYYKISKEDEQQFESILDNTESVVLYSKFDNMEKLQAEEYAERLLESTVIERRKEDSTEGVQELEELSDEIFFNLEENQSFNNNLEDILRTSLNNWSVRRNNY